MLDSSAKLSHDASAMVDHTRALVEDGRPFLDARAQTFDQTRRWAHNLAGFTDQMVKDDAQFRELLHIGPGFAQGVSRLLDQLKPILPVFLANLSTIGQIGVTYRPALEQLLVLLPPSVAAYGSYGVTNNPTGLAVGGFTLTIADPPACTVGFLPPSQWRSPVDVSEADTLCVSNSHFGEEVVIFPLTAWTRREPRNFGKGIPRPSPMASGRPPRRWRQR